MIGQLIATLIIGVLIVGYIQGKEVGSRVNPPPGKPGHDHTKPWYPEWQGLKPTPPPGRVMTEGGDPKIVEVDLSHLVPPLREFYSDDQFHVNAGMTTVHVLYTTHDILPLTELYLNGILVKVLTSHRHKVCSCDNVVRTLITVEEKLPMDGWIR